MGRSVNDIQKQILDAKAAATELNALQVLTTSEQTLLSADSTSKVAIWRLVVFIVAVVIWFHEQIVSKNAQNSRPQNLPNFIAAILNFHDGLSLKWKDGQFQYDLTGVSNPDELMIIDRCAVLESDDGELVVKVAHDNAGDLGPISNDEATRLMFYIKQIKVPGVHIRLVNTTADLIKTTLDVYVDPQMIDLNTGQLLGTSETIKPVEVAIKEYLNALEFNGAFVVDFFKSTIVAKEGINLVKVENMQWSFDGMAFSDFEDWKVPEAGYFKINEVDLTINYLPYVLVNA